MDLDLTTLHDLYTSDQLVKDANAAPTVRAGRYRFKPEEVTGNKDDRPSDQTKTPGRESIRVRVTAFALSADGATVLDRAGTVFFNASWQEYRNDKGELDGQSKLWGNLFKVFDVKPGETSVSQIVGLIKAGQFDGFVSEPIVSADGKFQNYKTDDERAKLIADGGEPKNFVQRLMKAK